MAEIKDVLKQRGDVHGAFKNNASISQQLKTVVASSMNYCQLSAVQKEALDLICGKISRVLSGNPDFPDHWLDIEGYARLVYNDLPTREEE